MSSDLSDHDVVWFSVQISRFEVKHKTRSFFSTAKLTVMVSRIILPHWYYLLLLGLTLISSGASSKQLYMRQGTCSFQWCLCQLSHLLSGTLQKFVILYIKFVISVELSSVIVLLISYLNYGNWKPLVGLIWSLLRRLTV